MKPMITGAASAVALSAALVEPGALAVQFVATSTAEAAVVSRIEVSGNQRVDADTIRNYITIKPGKAFSSSDIDSAVKALFGTGLFSDVQINQVGSTLVAGDGGAVEAARDVLAGDARCRRRIGQGCLQAHRPRRCDSDHPGHAAWRQPRSGDRPKNRLKFAT